MFSLVGKISYSFSYGFLMNRWQSGEEWLCVMLRGGSWLMHCLISQMNGLSCCLRHAFLSVTSALSIATYQDPSTALWVHLMNMDPMGEGAIMKKWHLWSTSPIGVRGLNGLKLIENLQLRSLLMSLTTPSSKIFVDQHVMWMSTTSKQCWASKRHILSQTGASLMWTGQEVVLTLLHLGRLILKRNSSRRFLIAKYVFTITSHLHFVTFLLESLLQVLWSLYWNYHPKF